MPKPKQKLPKTLSDYLDRLLNLTSVFLILFEQFITAITVLLPEPVISACTIIVKKIFRLFKSNDKLYNKILSGSNDNPASDIDSDLDLDQFDDASFERLDKLRKANDLEDIVELNGFRIESILVQTRDDYLLTVHRLNPALNGFKPNGKIIYFQHGLLMNSEIWCLMFEKNLNIPFVLCELGYDVYLGNNRGNKYSSKHTKLSISDSKFWDFSIDQFSMFDIPDSINHILKINNAKTLYYIGFSQGCSQILASISINSDLNSKIAKLILIAPATTPKKLSNWLLNSIVNFKPHLMFLLFGRKILLPSVIFWQKITYPPFFVKLIDIPNKVLFDWNSTNIDYVQKFISYFHLYSTTSVKSVVHWFQIIKSSKFQMYQDSDIFKSFEYPIDTLTIKKVLLIYGMSDSLVDINVMLSQLPDFTTISKVELSPVDAINKNFKELEFEKKKDLNKTELDAAGNSYDTHLSLIGVEGYEHLDLIWGKNIDYYVIDNVVSFLQQTLS